MFKFLFVVLLFNVKAWSQPLSNCITQQESFTTTWGEVIQYTVFKSQGWDIQKQSRSILALHGKGGDRFLYVGQGLCAVLDKIYNQTGKTTVAIAPDGHNTYWMNGAWTHKDYGYEYAVHLINDATQKFNLNPSKSARGGFGESMGATGIWQLALNYPETFGALAIISARLRTYEEYQNGFYYEIGPRSHFNEVDPPTLMQNGKTLNIPVWAETGGLDPYKDRFTWAVNTYLKPRNNSQSVYRMGTDPIGNHVEAFWKYYLETWISWEVSQLN